MFSAAALPTNFSQVACAVITSMYVRMNVFFFLSYGRSVIESH